MEQPSSSNAQAMVKLPGIPLPIFHGNIEEWVSFRNKFNSLIGNSTSINYIDELHYLKASLRSEAANIQSPSDIFDSLWNALRKKYEIKRIILDQQINELFNIRTIIKESSTELQAPIHKTQKIMKVFHTMHLEQNQLSY